MSDRGLKAMAGTKAPKFGHFVVEFATPGIGHILKSAGCDFAFLDLEHSGFHFETVKSAVRYFEAADLPAIIRVPSHDYHHIARAMLENAADVMQAHLGNACVFLSGKKRLAFSPDALMRVHTAAVVTEDRLRHERDRLAVPTGDVLDDILVHHHFVGRAHERIEADVDLRLARGGHFMVVFLDGNAHLLHLQNHLAADVLLRVGRRHREVAFLVADLPAQVYAVLAHAPDG